MAAFTEQQKTEFSMQKWYDLSGKTAVVTGGITGRDLRSQDVWSVPVRK